MTTFNEAMVIVATNVKNIMTELGFAIEDKDVPNVFRVTPADWIYPNCDAVYLTDQHAIAFRYDENNPLQDIILEALIAHEMVHAYQNLDHLSGDYTDATLDTYWEQKHEREAYTVQDVYQCRFLSDPETRTATNEIITKHIETNTVEDLIEMVVDYRRKLVNH